jgi:hypothetical protein
MLEEESSLLQVLIDHRGSQLANAELVPLL